MNIRREVLKAIQEDNFELIIKCFENDSAATSKNLQMYVYGLPNDMNRWKAINYIGQLAGLYSESHDDLFRNVIRRFIWQMCEESANVPWASAEVVGSIIANVEGRRYQEFIGPLFYHTGLNDICYAGFFWVLPSLMRYHSETVLEFLPQTYSWFEHYEMDDMRAYAAIYFKQFPQAEMKEQLKSWTEDDRKVYIYSNGNLVEAIVSDLAKTALSEI